MPNDFNQPIIDEFRANNGRVGGMFEGARLLLLTTTGARTGAPHTTPSATSPTAATAFWSSPPRAAPPGTRPGITTCARTPK